MISIILVLYQLLSLLWHVFWMDEKELSLKLPSELGRHESISSSLAPVIPVVSQKHAKEKMSFIRAVRNQRESFKKPTAQKTHSKPKNPLQKRPRFIYKTGTNATS